MSTPDDPKVIYVLEKTGLAGGVKVVFEQANRLQQHSISTEIFCLDERPNWFAVEVPIRTFPTYQELSEQLRTTSAIKIATWWKTAPVVSASAKKSEGFYLVQDIESHYYDEKHIQADVLKTYDLSLRMLVESRWVERQLITMGKKCDYISIGIDHDIFNINPQVMRKNNIILVNAPRAAKTGEIKGMHVLERVLTHIQREYPSVQIISFSREKLPLNLSHSTYVHHSGLTDHEVATLYQTASCFLITSTHEGFCLPALEAMACGCPVVATRAGGNEEFCLDGKTCLLVNQDNERSIIDAVLHLLNDWDTAARLGVEGALIARDYTWEKVISSLVDIFAPKK